ncbi:cytochrome c oxidase assembly protein [Streptomyces sp. UNOB3_S3]|uniref:cytochrome c oxidase assembly protein n=1 Tax=Streptomyces sp. UNOB3_S3 TaxID=2871682 RepID=UPI001E5C3CDB|nr:cytochrome c oxidase assembly protein [Streptomyces sp. UNOB3_S3]MCC3773395.1 cytochrome c oxidase assembly protein [Streptomyces sp. UNOB3_S3]
MASSLLATGSTALALPGPTPGRWAGTWQADPFGIAAVVLLGGLYGWGVLRARRNGHRWPAVRTAAFAVLGLGTVAVATMSSLAVYGRVLFWPAAVQNILLDLVAPLGLALGDPLALARLALPERGADRLGRVLRGRLLRVLTFPVIGTLLVLASELSVYFTPYFETALRDGAVHSLLYLQLLLSGCLFVLPVLSREDLLPAWCTHPLRALFVFVDGLVDAIPGILVMSSGTRIAAGWYAARQPGWGPGPDRDQVLGGGLMLAIAELVGLPFLIAVFVEWVRAERVRTAELDRRLDAEAALAAPAPAQEAVAPGRVPVPEATRPWWETDPGVVGERFRQGRGTL